MEQTGKIKHIGDVQQISDRFKKRDLVLEFQEGNYMNTVPFEFTRDKTDLLDTVKVGDNVVVNFKLRGREVTNKDGIKRYYPTLDAWKITKQ